MHHWTGSSMLPKPGQQTLIDVLLISCRCWWQLRRSGTWWRGKAWETWLCPKLFACLSWMRCTCCMRTEDLSWRVWWPGRCDRWVSVVPAMKRCAHTASNFILPNVCYLCLVIHKNPKCIWYAGVSIRGFGFQLIKTYKCAKIKKTNNDGLCDFIQTLRNMQRKIAN